MSIRTVFNRATRHYARIKLLVLQQGASAHKIALALSLGTALGLMPLLWGTSLLCFVLAWALRLNHVIVQSVNYLLYPAQIALLAFFFRLGAAIFNPGMALGNTLEQYIHHPDIAVLPLLLRANIYAVWVWAVAAAGLIPVLFFLFLQLIQRWRT